MYTNTSILSLFKPTEEGKEDALLNYDENTLEPYCFITFFALVPKQESLSQGSPPALSKFPLFLVCFRSIFTLDIFNIMPDAHAFILLSMNPLFKDFTP